MASEASGYLARLTARAAAEKTVHADLTPITPPTGVAVASCPGCGAGRARADGLTRCAYCGHEFMSRALTDGIYLSSSDNSER